MAAPPSDGYSQFREVARGMWAPIRWLLGQTTEGETPNRLIGDQLRIQDVLNRYALAYDSNDLEALMQVFRREATLITSRGTYVGADAIRRNYTWLMEQRESSFHTLSNTTVRVLANRTAWSVSYFHVFQLAKSGILQASVGTYFDRLVKEGSSWAISERRITGNLRYVMASEAGPPRPSSPEPTYPETSRDLMAEK